MANIVVYTDYFPYGNSETFLETELIYLCEKFETVFIQPLNGGDLIRKVPLKVQVLNPLETKSCRKIRMYIHGFLNLYLLLSEKSFRRNLHRISLFKALKYIGFGIWIKNEIRKKLVIGRVIHYSYWLNYSAFALALLHRERKNILFISRAHRFDLYTDKGETALDFIKPFTIKYLRKLFLISQDGVLFLNRLYPEYLNKYKLSRLGTSDPGFLNLQGLDEPFSLVSCSNLKRSKRIELILEALICLSRIHPDVEVIWVHLGDGEEFEEINKKAKREFDQTRIKYNLKGRLSNHEVFEFYRNHSVDILINVSETEGIPVSIMEAQSCAIPVLATEVGGIAEIVNNKNGLLVGVNIRPEELATVLYQIYQDRESWKEKRILSRENWEQMFNAEQNYSSFSSQLMEMSLPAVDE